MLPTDLEAVAGILEAAYRAATPLGGDQRSDEPPIDELAVLASLMIDDAEGAIGSLLEGIVRATPPAS